MTLSGVNHRNSNELEDPAFAIIEAGAFGVVVAMSSSGAGLAWEIARRFPAVTQINRLFLPGDWFPSPDDAVAYWHDHIRDTAGAVRYYQVDNEPDERLPNVTPEAYCEWWRKVVAMLRAEFPGKRWGFPMPSIRGHESVKYMECCREGIAFAEWVAERSYWQELWQLFDEDWGARWKRVLSAWPGKETHICEFGCSAVLSPEERATQYRWFLEGLPESIASASVYIMAGGTDDWQLFWIDEALARDIRIEEITAPASSEGDFDMEYQVGQGILDAMKAHGEQPSEDEQYLWPGIYSSCASSEALYFYSFATNQVYRSPKA